MVGIQKRQILVSCPDTNTVLQIDYSSKALLVSYPYKR